MRWHTYIHTLRLDAVGGIDVTAYQVDVQPINLHMEYSLHCVKVKMETSYHHRCTSLAKSRDAHTSEPYTSSN